MDGFGVSDLSRGYGLRAINLDLNRALVQLSEEVVTGRASDTTLRLNAQFSFLTQIETDLVQTQARAEALTEVAITAQAQQTALGRVVDNANDMFNTLAVAQNDAGALTASSLAEQARGILDTMMAALNSNQGGRYAFSGVEVDTPPLVSSADLLSDLTTAISSATTEIELRMLVDDFFDQPTGGFASGTYQGATQNLSPINLGNGETVTLTLRADDPALREMLKAVAIMAVADEPSLSIPDALRRPLIMNQTDAVLNARSEVIELRAQLGFSEERLDRSTTRLETEQTTLELARSDLIDVDAFEAATALEAVRQQLETLFSVTARTQNLNLVNFL
ncbi:MAG: flagellin [Pseudomonadota bacterium]